MERGLVSPTDGRKVAGNNFFFTSFFLLVSFTGALLSSNSRWVDQGEGTRLTQPWHSRET